MSADNKKATLFYVFMLKSSSMSGINQAGLGNEDSLFFFFWNPTVMERSYTFNNANRANSANQVQSKFKRLMMVLNINSVVLFSFELLVKSCLTALILYLSHTDRDIASCLGTTAAHKNLEDTL